MFLIVVIVDFESNKDIESEHAIKLINLINSKWYEFLLNKSIIFLAFL